MRPTVPIVLAIAVLGLGLAWLSPGVPLGLAGLTTLLIAIGVVPEGTALGPAMLLWVIAGTGLALLRHRRQATSLPTILTAPLVLSAMLAVLMQVRLPGSWDPSYGASKLSLFITFNIVLLIAGSVVAQRPRDLDMTLALMLLLSTVGAVAMTLEIVGGAQPVFDGRYALSGSGDPIDLGRTSTIGILIAAYLVLFRGPRVRLVALVSLAPLTVALLASGSRGPFLGLVVGMAVLLWRRSRVSADGAPVRHMLLAIAVAAVVAVQVAPVTSIDRAAGVFIGGSERSSNGRSDLWSVGWNGFADHPLLGLGTGGFGQLAPGTAYPHSLFLEAGVELGVLGVVLVAGIVVLGGARLFRRPPGGGLARGQMIAVSALFVAAVVNSLFSGDITTNSAIWLALGLGIGISQRRDAPAPAPEPAVSRRPSGAPAARTAPT